MFLEYEQSGNLDDIVIFDGNEITAYQVKNAVNALESMRLMILSIKIVSSTSKSLPIVGTQSDNGTRGII